MTTTTRFDLYTTIHKTQRFHLGRLAERMGRAEATDFDIWPSLGAEVRDWLGNLKAHAHHEHDLIHPLFERIGNDATQLDADHRALEHSMDDLEQAVREGRWGELYARFAAFLGTYFAHTAEEERLQAVVLWPFYSDAELSEVFIRFKRSRSEEDARRDLELMLPALSLGELARIYEGIRLSAPPAVWEASLALAQRVLGPSDLEQLKVRLFPCKG